MTTAEDRIVQLAEKVRRFKSEAMALSEQDTKAVLVEPLLEIIGWDVHDPAKVTREDKPTIRPVDYSLKLKGKPVVLVECKRLSNRLDSAGDLEQALSYASSAGVRWCVLTNGSLFRIYNSLAPEVAGKKLLEEVNLAAVGQTEGVSPEKALQTLQLVSPDSVEMGLIDQAWEQRYTGTKILEVVRDLWNKPDTGLVHLVRERMRDRGRTLSKQETKEWLGELDITVRLKAGPGQQQLAPTTTQSGVRHGDAEGRGGFSTEPGAFELDELERRLRETLERESDLTPRIVCFLEILLSEDRAFRRREVREGLFARGIGRDIGHAGRYLSNVSMFITTKSNPHLRQVVQFESRGKAGARKDNYRLVAQYRAMVQSLVDEWRESHR